MTILPKVILPLIISGLFFISVMAAIGRPQFATGPQKCCKKSQQSCQCREDTVTNKLHQKDKSRKREKKKISLNLLNKTFRTPQAGEIIKTSIIFFSSTTFSKVGFNSFKRKIHFNLTNGQKMQKKKKHLLLHKVAQTHCFNYM